ncbi:Histone deacetylase 2 [Chionoecetes opilio]|uniref:Histone deacetylase 2 n=1 Tax=Chionoecetes opilio TaxID=41210 RepID=A0A8J8WD74_CHIOP|nr:Histone deacetylase 2 [Chionoecetes opilio]
MFLHPGQWSPGDWAEVCRSMASVSPEETVGNDVNARPKEMAADSKLYMDVGEECVSIVYRDEYNIHLLGMEKLHPFDACKWGNVVKHLKRKHWSKELKVVSPNEARESDLRLVHSASYLRSLKVRAEANTRPLSSITL